MSFGFDAFNNLAKDDKGNFLKLGWQQITGTTILSGIAAAMVVLYSVRWRGKM